MIFILISLFTAMFSRGLVLDPDLGWHVFLGSKMIESKTLITHAVGYNYFSRLNIPDHEWLSDIILFKLSQHGMWTIVLGFFALTLIFGFLLSRAAQKQSKSKKTILSALILVVITASLSYGIRLQVILLVAVALFVYLYLCVPNRKTRYFWYAIMTIAGINLHGGFLTIIPIPLLLELPLGKSEEHYLTRRSAWILLVMILGACLLLNPYGVKYWQLVSNYATSRAYLSGISEWQPVYAFPVRLWNCIIPLSIVIFCLFFNNFWKKLRLNWLLLLLMYGVLGIRFVRFFPIFMILVLPMLVLAIDDLKENALPKKTSNIATVSLIIYVLLYFIFNLQNPINGIVDPFSDASYPAGASAFLSKNTPKTGNLLNPYEWGGYLLEKNPKNTVFIDGRGPQVIVADKISLLEEYQKFNSENTDTIKMQLEKYNISVVLANTTPYELDSFNKYLLKLSNVSSQDLFTPPNLNKFLASSPEWQSVYTDNISEVFFRKDK